MAAVQQAPAGAPARQPGPATGFCLWRYYGWQIEVDIRSIKSTMKMDVLRCKTPEMVRKEIWMHLLAYNLIRTVMAQAARGHGLAPREISFKGALQTLNAFRGACRITAGKACVRALAHLYAAIAMHL